MLNKLNKRLVLLLVSFFVLNSVVDDLQHIVPQSGPIRENIFLSTTLSFLDSRGEDNLSQPDNILCLLFVETIYEKFVKDELPSFKVITTILSRPFVNLWFVKEVFELVLSSVYYIINETKKFICITKVVCLTSLFLPFILLFSIKSRLKTHRLAPMVLRC